MTGNISRNTPLDSLETSVGPTPAPSICAPYSDYKPLSISAFRAFVHESEYNVTMGAHPSFLQRYWVFMGAFPLHLSRLTFVLLFNCFFFVRLIVALIMNTKALETKWLIEACHASVYIGKIYNVSFLKTIR